MERTAAGSKFLCFHVGPLALANRSRNVTLLARRQPTATIALLLLLVTCCHLARELRRASTASLGTLDEVVVDSGEQLGGPLLYDFVQRGNLPHRKQRRGGPRGG
jgi:hypothetical protein